MNTPHPLSITGPTPKFSVEAARLLLEQALEAETADEHVEVDENVASKGLIDACTGASLLVPPEVIAIPATALADSVEHT